MTESIQGLQVLLGFVLLLLTPLALQPIKDVILGEYPDIHAAIVTADSERISVVLSNSGNGTAALEGINISPTRRAAVLGRRFFLLVIFKTVF